MSLSIEQFQALALDESVYIIDTRPADLFVDGCIHNALNITPATIKFAIAMGVLTKETPIIFIIEEDQIAETMAYFTKAEFSQIKGYLQGGFSSWLDASKRFDLIIEVEVDELAMDIPFDEYLMVLDTREEDAFNKQHIKNAVSLPLSEMGDPGSMSELDEHFNIYIITDNGESNTLAASILKKQGIHNIRIVKGGWEELLQIKHKFSFETTPKKSAEEDPSLN
jgi:rhodanese-related sulfurtransferase